MRTPWLDGVINEEEEFWFYNDDSLQDGKVVLVEKNIYLFWDCYVDWILEY